MLSHTQAISAILSNIKHNTMRDPLWLKSPTHETLLLCNPWTLGPALYNTPVSIPCLHEFDTPCMVGHRVYCKDLFDTVCMVGYRFYGKAQFDYCIAIATCWLCIEKTDDNVQIKKHDKK